MSDMRDNSGIFDIVARTVDESERRLRPELQRLAGAIDGVRIEVHGLKILRENDNTHDTVKDVSKTVGENSARIQSLERWRAYVTGAVAVLTVLAASFGVLAYQTLTDVEKDVAVLKARSE